MSQFAVFQASRDGQFRALACLGFVAMQAALFWAAALWVLAPVIQQLID